ncbi:MAG: hypothetical protein ACI9YH_002975 [Colwellia sp.]|jgi:hypothetical protein
MKNDKLESKRIQKLANEINQDMLKTYGPVLYGKDLYLCLGYKSISGFYRALKSDQLEVEVFDIENKRGKHALTKDVALWLARSKLLPK